MYMHIRVQGLRSNIYIYIRYLHEIIWNLWGMLIGGILQATGSTHRVLTAAQNSSSKFEILSVEGIELQI